MSAEAATSFRSGLQFQAAGESRRAAAAFLTAFGLAPDVPAHRRAAFDVLNVMTGYRELPALVMAGLEASAELPDIDIQPLSLVVRNLFARDPRLETLSAKDDIDLETALQDAAWFLENRLLKAILTRAVNISLLIEIALVRLRAHLLRCVADGRQTVLLERFRPFAIALTAQNVINCGVWAESPNETNMAAALRRRSDADAVLARAAYRPLSEMTSGEAVVLPPELQTVWREQHEEHALIASLPHFTPLAAGLSAVMQAQYERYPYPRWRQIDVGSPVPFDAFLQQRIPTRRFAVIEGAVEMLVAGCGTGRPALSLALGVKHTRVTAIDLSRVSLAYATRMAGTLGAANITFGVADILQLGGWDRQFHLIDCSGVLHHMADPAMGLKILRGLLQPDGVMLVSLYSARGRAAEVAAQRFVHDRGFPDTPDGLRRARTALAALPANHPARPVTDTPDYFTRDGLHDLIFNVHESLVTPSEMKQLLAAADLKALHVDAPAILGGAAFRAAHPDPTQQADLDLWDGFERTNPQVFAHMIPVWCGPA